VPAESAPCGVNRTALTRPSRHRLIAQVFATRCPISRCRPVRHRPPHRGGNRSFAQAPGVRSAGTTALGHTARLQSVRWHAADRSNTASAYRIRGGMNTTFVNTRICLQQAANPIKARPSLATRACPVAWAFAVLPNPSLKPSPNGGPPGPGCRYAVHCLHPGPGVPPSGPA
jgi:hypothetical protein